MKIRTDFVTNSSSSSFVVLKIQNKEFRNSLKEIVESDKWSPEYHYMDGDIKLNNDMINLELNEVWDMENYIPDSVDELKSIAVSLFNKFEPVSNSSVDVNDNINNSEYIKLGIGTEGYGDEAFDVSEMYSEYIDENSDNNNVNYNEDDEDVEAILWIEYSDGEISKSRTVGTPGEFRF